MGWLDHSTNNIILDAVLTDIGREFLARNDGSFNIVKFSLSDEDVDYSIIKKYGRTVGKEKIEKNTPVFEAITNQEQAQKYRCVSVSNPNLLRLPNLTLTGDGFDSSNTVLSMDRRESTQRNITVTQTIQGVDTIDVELRDQAFMIEMNNLFLEIQNSQPDTIDTKNSAQYLLTRAATSNAKGGSSLTFTLALKNITNEQFTVYGNTSDKNTIQTYVKVSGLQSGAVKEFTINITRVTSA